MFLYDNSSFELKYKYQFVIKLKAVQYYKILFYYLSFDISL